MKQPKLKIIPADKTLRKNYLIFFALYILLLVWVEPIVDYFLTLTPWDGSNQAIAALNERKAYIMIVVLGLARSLPIIVFFGLGYKITQAQRLPPRGMRLPLAVMVIEGPKARMIGVIIMGITMLLLLRELSLIISGSA